MTGKGAHLTLRPDRCNECGACLSACPRDALRIAASYILVDWNECDQCCECVDACERAAILRAVVPARASAAMPAVVPGDVAKVVVGSRAEAKAVRKAAEKAAKQAGKSPKQVARATASSRSVVMRAAAVGGSGAATVAVPGVRASAAPSRAPKVPEMPAPRFGTAEWTLVDAVALLVLLLVILFGKNAVRDLPAVALMPAAGRMFVRASLLILYYAIQFGVFALLAGRHGARLAEAFGLSRRDADESDSSSAVGMAGLVLSVFLGVEVVSLIYGYVAQAVGWRQPLTLSSDVAAVFGRGGIGVVLAVALVAVAAPLAEELAFRGVVLPVLGRRWGMVPAIVVSSVLFAATHFNLWMFFPTLVLGLASAWLAWTRRSLWPSIAVHVLYNAVAVAAAFLIAR